jgi:hypothetical protein
MSIEGPPRYSSDMTLWFPPPAPYFPRSSKSLLSPSFPDVILSSSLRQNVHRGLRQVRVILFGVASDRSCRGGNLVRVTELERIHAYLSLKCTTGTRGMGEYAVSQLNNAIQMAETAMLGVKADS